MKKLTLSIGLLAMAAIGIAQNVTVRGCATMDLVSPETIQAMEQAIAPKIAAYKQNLQLGGSPEAVITVPTVVHIIHNTTEAVGNGRNISGLRVTQQIQVLNDDFRRTNADASNTPSYFLGAAADCEINFCLVTKYPSGHPNAGQTLAEPGIDRVSTADISGISNTSSGYGTNTINNTIKPATSWNPDEVFNIWVCQLPNGLLGYATFPNSVSPNRDGVVIGFQYFGLTGGNFGKGRTTTHEVGHWMGLYHIWGDDNGACSGSDQCGDTPNQANSTGGCPSGLRQDACAPSSTGYMYMNYMDYSYDACMNMFTNDQKSRIQTFMSTTPRRNTLPNFASTLCNITDIEEVEEKGEINIYPNPSTGIINLTFKTQKKRDVIVYNVLGEMVASVNTDELNTMIDLSNQSKGIYFVKIKTGNVTFSKKVTIAN